MRDLLGESSKLLPNFEIAGTFEIKNYGPSPAWGVNTNVEAWIPVSTEELINRPDKKWFMCFDRPAQSGSGEELFPNGPLATFAFAPQAVRMVHSSTYEISRIWLIGCVSYKDGFNHIWHTRFWMRSTHPDDAAWISMGPTLKHMPITGFASWGEETEQEDQHIQQHR